MISGSVYDLEIFLESSSHRELLHNASLFDNVLTLNVLSFHSGRKITGLGAHWMILRATLKILSGVFLQKFFDYQN